MGRLTMPRGTFLSNPATASDGVTEGGSGSLPPTPQINPWEGVTPGANKLLAPSAASNPWVGSQYVAPRYENNYNPLSGPFNQSVDAFRSVLNTFNTAEAAGTQAIRDALNIELPPAVTTPTSVFKSPSTNSPSNTLVGNQVLNSPLQISSNQLRQIMPRLSPKQLQDTMASRGYVRQYRSGVGEIWVKTGEASTTAPIGSTPNGRPEYVDPTSLDRGERVTSAAGFTYVGGQDYTDKEGNTVSQYSLTIPGGPRAGEDKHGKYKWVSTVQRDRDGNWVRVNRQVLRKVYSRSHKKKQQARAEQAAQAQGQQNQAEYNQLVNLRVNYG